jgi:hypothetical protein
MGGNGSSELTALAARFADTPEFASSPLYRALSRTVADSPGLLKLVARRRPGQHPTLLFFGAVHALLLSGARHQLADYFPSIVGEDAGPPDEAGPALVDFCAAHASRLAALIETRLVQTNVVKRALALRYGLARIARQVQSPVHLIEVGASAGLLLRFDRYGYQLAGQRFGVRESPVQMEAEWHSEQAVPDLDTVPALASVTGIDLNPLDASSLADRQWLEALVWPENRYEAQLLHQALALVAADPPPIHVGNAIELCPRLAAGLPPGEPRVVFHSMTRMHVPAAQLAQFDAAISEFGRGGPLYWLSLEGQGELDLRGPDGAHEQLARVGGRIEWITPRRTVVPPSSGIRLL